jgi:hypothetical protein
MHELAYAKRGPELQQIQNADDRPSLYGYQSYKLDDMGVERMLLCRDETGIHGGLFLFGYVLML